jgi:hypothetical protein
MEFKWGCQMELGTAAFHSHREKWRGALRA